MLSFDHVGCAVANIRKAMKAMETAGYSFGDVLNDEAWGVSISFGRTGAFCVELIAPLRHGSPVDAILSSMGASPYHICFQSDDFERDMKRCILGGYKCLDSPAPAVAFQGRRVVFLYSNAAGLMEIVEVRWNVIA